jgi:hypothetical protein
VEFLYQKLAQDIAKATYDDLLRMVRTLVGSDAASLFGDTEFTVRDISHHTAAKALNSTWSKKTATKGPPQPAWLCSPFPANSVVLSTRHRHTI